MGPAEAWQRFAGMGSWAPEVLSAGGLADRSAGEASLADPSTVDNLRRDDPWPSTLSKVQPVPSTAGREMKTRPTSTQADLSFLGPPQAPGELGRLGVFAIYDVLGEGGMGVVLLAEDPGLARRIALKVMQPRYAGDPKARERFLREARAMARVKSDRVVTVHQVGEADGMPFVAMELLAGESLAERLRRESPLPWRDAARLGVEAAEGLEAAHQQGLIHRDIKPANLWLEANPGLKASPGLTPGEARVKILDFGLAHVTEAEEALTRSGMVVGTPFYMAPEQAAAQPVDARADLFSLGCVLYEAVTGRRPFGGGSTMAVLQQLALHHPPPPIQLRPEIPPALSGLIEILLAKNREQRPGSARAVIAALQPLTSEQPQGAVTASVPAVPPASSSIAPPIPPSSAPVPFPARPPVSGQRRLLLAGLAVLVLMGGGAVWYGLTKRGGGHAGGGPPPDPAAQPLRGELIVRVWNKDRSKKGAQIGVNAEALPVRMHDKLHMEARLNQPAYVYLLWVDGKGVVTPLYPWNPEERVIHRTLPPVPPAQTPRAEVHNPSGLASGWEADNTAGLDTILLLVRTTPLPEDVRLLDVIGKVPEAPLGPVNEVVVRGLNAGQPAEEVKLDQERAPLDQAKAIDDQLVQLMDRLKDHFELIRAVQFAHVGK